MLEQNASPKRFLQIQAIQLLLIINKMMLMAYKNPEQSRFEGIVGKQDDRKRVDKKKQPHYRAIGLLKPISADPGKRLCGTAFLIGPRTIVTAAHNIFLDKNIEGFYFYPSAYGEIDIPDPSIPAHCQPVKVISWKHQKDFELQPKDRIASNGKDFAVMILESNVYLDEYPTFGLIKVLKGMRIEILGYPGEKQHKGDNNGHVVIPFVSQGEISIIETSMMLYTANTTPGQSGSPIFAQINGHLCIIGMHNGFSATHKLNRGIYISSDKLHTIKQWRDDLLQSLPNDSVKKAQIRNRQLVYQPVQPHQIYCPSNLKWAISQQLSTVFRVSHTKLQRISSLSKNTRIEFLFSEESLSPIETVIVKCQIVNISQQIAVGVIKLKDKDKQIYRKEPFNPIHLYKLCEVGYRVYKHSNTYKGQFFPLSSSLNQKPYQDLFRNQAKNMQKGDHFGFEVDGANSIVKLFQKDQLVLEIIVDRQQNQKLYLVAIFGGVGDSLYINLTP